MSALFPAGTRRCEGPARKRRNPRPPAGPDDETFGFLPACLLENADQVCLLLFGYLALRCGKDNRHQRGWKQIGQALNVDWRTLKRHGEYLAGMGWLNIHATTTATGAHRAIEIWLAHCPPLKIRGQNARTPSRDHAKSGNRTVVQPLHPDSEEIATTVVGQTAEPGATVVTSEPECGTTNAPPSRYVEVVGASVLNTSRAKPFTEDEMVARVFAAFPGAEVVKDLSA